MFLQSVYVTTEGQCTGCVMVQDAVCAAKVWRGSDVNAVNQDTTPFQIARVRMSVHPPCSEKTYEARKVFIFSMALFSVPILISETVQVFPMLVSVPLLLFFSSGFVYSAKF